MEGRVLYNSTYKNYKDADCYISKVVKEAYKYKYLISNPVISRSPDSSNLIKNICCNTELYSSYSNFNLILKVIKYYFNSSIHILVFITHHICYKISRLKFNKKNINYDDELVIISTFTMIDKIYINNALDDKYFGYLYKILEDNNIQYVVLCSLFGDKNTNYRRRLKTYNILSNENVNYLTEFEYLNIYDYFELFTYIIKYPFYTIKLINQKYGKYDKLLKQELYSSLHKVTFYKYVKYIFGKKLQILSKHKLKVFMWYENQVSDKLLIKGIRDSKIESYIYGCQFYPKCDVWLNEHPLLIEKEYDLLPDKIIVSGKKYYCNKLNINQALSPRYNYLFQYNVISRKIVNNDTILVILSYYEEENNCIIACTQELYKHLNNKIIVKQHPNNLLNSNIRLPNSWDVSNDNLIKLSTDTTFAITGSTTASVESVCLGLSTIIVGRKNNITLNYFNGKYKKIIWDVIFNSSEIYESYSKLKNTRKRNINNIKTIMEDMRNDYFSKSCENSYYSIFNM